MERASNDFPYKLLGGMIFGSWMLISIAAFLALCQYEHWVNPLCILGAIIYFVAWVIILADIIKVPIGTATKTLLIFGMFAIAPITGIIYLALRKELLSKS